MYPDSSKKKLISFEEILSKNLLERIEKEVEKYIDELNYIYLKDSKYPLKEKVQFLLKFGELEIISKEKFLKKTNYLKFELIKKVVCDYFNVDFNYICLKKRDREIIYKRQVLQYFFKMHTKYSLAEIGEKTGGYNHSTILHSVKAINNLIDTNRINRQEIMEMDRKIKNILQE